MTAPDYKNEFDRVINRNSTESLKWDKYKDRDIIPLWVADMDFVSPRSVIDALNKRVDHGVFGYTHAPEELTEQIINGLAQKYNWIIEKEWLIWLPGLVTGLNVACRAIGNDGDDVLTVVPIYPPFLSAPGNSNRNLITVPLVKNNNRWMFDFEEFEKAITENTKLFMFCNPHNPTGRVYSKEEILTMAAICERHDMIICSDEIHNDLILDADKQHVPTATLGPEIARRTITFMAPSKTYNLPGLGCSFAIISDPDLRIQFQRAMQGIVPFVNVFGYTAALAAYRDGAEWHRALLDYLAGNRDLLAERIDKLPGISVNHVEATYLAWLDLTATGLSDPAAHFENFGVGLSDGKEFGAPGFLRLNFGCPRPLLEKALHRIEQAVVNTVN